MSRRFYVTTPIYYVNAEPHIGHAYTTVLADFLKRHYDMLGYETFFLTGTDEHGDKIAKAAAAHNETPKAYTDHISGKFRDAWKRMSIQNDDFIRTTEARHIKVVREILQKVYDQGDIYFGSYGGHYCVGCERFLTEKDIVDGKCPEHGKPVEYISESNYFFKMKKYQGWLIEHIEKNPDFIRPERYRNEVLAILRGGELEDLCISRPKSRLEWGVPLPFDENFVTYVWFDALINYISAIEYPDGEKWQKYWPEVRHLIAKDILKPHGVFWPTMLKAAGIEPYQSLNVHGYWNMEDAKMSKTLGNVVRPDDLLARYGNDQTRYFFLREMTFGHDAKFSDEAVTNRVNYDLANDLGNLINRTLNMVSKYFDGKVPARGSDDAGLPEMRAALAAACDDYLKAVDSFEFSQGLEKLWEFVRSLNRYIDQEQPWALAKKGETDRLASVMRNLLEAMHAVICLLAPVLIESAPRVREAFGTAQTSIAVARACGMDVLETGFALGNPGILFPRIEKEEKKEPEQSAAAVSGKKQADSKAAPTTAGANQDGLVEIGDFAKIELRVAKVLQAERVEGSDKLLRLQISVGDLGTRQIVAGIAQAAAPEQIAGRKIIVVANLKPAVIFKQESKGMLLAAKMSKADLPQVILVDDSVPEGARLG